MDRVQSTNKDTVSQLGSIQSANLLTPTVSELADQEIYSLIQTQVY